MFTGTTIPFSEFSGRFGLSVVRDCQFAYAGKIPTNLPNRIVAVQNELHIRQGLKAGGVVGFITPPNLFDLIPSEYGVATSDAPFSALLMLQGHICELPDFQWRDFDSEIHPSVIIHDNVSIANKNVRIGEGTVLYPGAVVLPRTIIGEHCSIGSGTVLGTDAFEVDVSTDPFTLVKQSGGVHIGNHVDIQAKCTVVRATFGGFTELGEGSKLDCQIHFAHDCRAGRNVRIAACAEISGRVEIGDGVFIGPNASISNGILIGANAKITIGSVVTRDVPEGETVTGNFAVSHKKWLSFMRTLK